MAETSQAEVQRLVDRAIKLGDAELAADIRAFAKQREFGLVFEHNRPERMRLYGKLVSVGDTVQVMAPRGERETDENKVCWRVESVTAGVAKLAGIDVPGDTRDAALEDLVSVAEYDEPIYAGLRETGRVERGGDKPYQVVINGENYHALESLLFCYAGKVDCIYIDPPYNTGARDWKYNNDYVDGGDEYRHSKWLAMMERRLKLAKELLNPRESVLIVTIDEKEYLRLGMLLEQVFDGSRVQMISSVINPAGVARQGEFARTDEYIYIVYIGSCTPQKVVLGDEWLGGVGSSCKNTLHWNSLMRTGTNSLRSDRPNLFYPIYVSNDGTSIVHIGDSLPRDMSRFDVSNIDGCKTVWPIRTNGDEGNWQISQGALRKCIDKGFVRLGRFTDRGMAISYLKSGEQKKIETGLFPVIGFREDGSVIVDDSEYEAKYIPGTQWRIASHDASRNGSGMIRRLIPGRAFTFPKSLYAVEDTIRFFVANMPEALVVDFFSGSGTTAHAVMRLNHQDGGRRRCICVTNNEVSDEEEKRLTRQGHRHGDPEWEQLGICEYVTKPRIRAAITGLTPDGEPIKGDYKFVDEFPMADGLEENAVFFDLTYENPRMVEFGESFDAVAPLLWLRAGARGRIIEREQKGFAIADSYAVLFTYAYANEFVEAVSANPDIRCVYVVTDDEGRFASVASQLPGRDVVRLYESYLRSFKIAAEGAVN
ncbi:site-specific DNA-methyltransferase [Candidatus Collinsella stercoripullorum]|uniref:site-specific DNA-methyltransferase n=1 Tax=Candidatus Collinsella stercoripullorum TaxID=2838522 RepID=UPI0022E4C3AF|nr:DNA methyltransferase [Candidatus Collinsella stercoripullorum]